MKDIRIFDDDYERILIAAEKNDMPEEFVIQCLLDELEANDFEI